MRLFSEPTYRERASNFAHSLGERVTDGIGRMTDSVPDITDEQFARGLGWASIGIGLTELLAPTKVNEMLGLDDTPDRRGTTRVLGVRELCQGLSILTSGDSHQKLTA